MSRTRRGAAHAVLPFFAFLAADAAAQATLVPDVIVSASRVPVAAREVGSAVTVLDGADLERRQIREVAEALRTVPGLSVRRSGGVGSVAQVRIRGAEANHTLVLIDGVEVNDVSGGSEFDFGDLLAVDIDRIEVLRGPQSAVWGSDAIGGVVNVVTRRGAGKPSGTVRMEGGSHRTGELAGALRAGGEAWHFNLAGSAFGTRGISVADARNGNGEADAFRRETLQLRTGFSPFEILHIDLVGRYARARIDNDGFAGGIGAIDDDVATVKHQRSGRAQARLELLGGAWEHVAGVAYSDDDRDNLTGPRETSNFQGDKRKFDYRTTYTFRTPGFADARHTLTGVAEHERDGVYVATGFSTVDRSIEQDGFAGEYRLALWDSLFLSGSLRHDANELFDDADTWRATAAYLYAPTETRLHASAGKGVKNPTLFELFGFTAGFVGNPNLTPEEAVGWDAGVEQSLWGGRATVDVTYFNNRIRELIQGSGNTAVNLPGTSRIQGIEATARVRVTDGIELSGGYTWTDAEDASATELVRRPRHMASLDATWRFVLFDRPGHLDGGVAFNGRQSDLVFDAFFNQQAVRLGGYSVARIGAGWEVAPDVKLFARLENAFDKDYQEVASYGTPGRAAYAGVTARF